MIGLADGRSESNTNGKLQSIEIKCDASGNDGNARYQYILSYRFSYKIDAPMTYGRDFSTASLVQLGD